MSTSMREMLEAGVHFGHQTRFWNPKMAPYIFGHRNRIHIINLEKSLPMFQEACKFARQLAANRGTILMVGTKRQAREILATEARRAGVPFVDQRWLGGMLTNFATIRKSLKKMSSLEKLMKEDGYKNLAKKERLMVSRQKEKMETILGGIADLSRLPAALFVVDIKREHIAIAEAQKLGIPVFALVDTNSNPNEVEFPIPANDDAFKSVSLLVHAFGAAIEEGLSERKKDKDDAKISEEEEAKRAVDAETKE